MRLKEWVQIEGHGSIARLARATGLSRPTVVHAINGGTLRVHTAKLLSRATEGVVSVETLLGLTGESIKRASQEGAPVQSPTEAA
jgi:hypothetical protein